MAVWYRRRSKDSSSCAGFACEGPSRCGGGAVAARDQARANTFAKKHRIPKAYGGEGAYQSMSSIYCN